MHSILYKNVYIIYVAYIVLGKVDVTRTSKVLAVGGVSQKLGNRED